MAMAMATARITAMFMAITPPQHVEIARTGQAVRDSDHVLELFRKRKGPQLGGPSRGRLATLATSEAIDLGQQAGAAICTKGIVFSAICGMAAALHRACPGRQEAGGRAYAGVRRARPSIKASNKIESCYLCYLKGWRWRARSQ
jgi:hypothetical protein